MSPARVSLHVGLGEVDPKAYGGWSGPLPGVRPDYVNMQRCAAARGYATRITLWNERATAANVLAAIAEAGDHLRAGGPGSRLLLSWSGHGGYITDTSGDEADGLDGTLLCWDRQLSDDELWAATRTLPPDCVVHMLIDACHAGTPSRAMDLSPIDSMFVLNGVRPRVAPRSVLASIPPPPQPDYTEAGPPVLALGACQDSQTAGDTNVGGVFTVHLLRVLTDDYDGTWQQLARKLKRVMPRDQKPKLTTEPTPDDPALIYDRVLAP